MLVTLNSPLQAVLKNEERGQIIARCTLISLSPQTMIRSEYSSEIWRLCKSEQESLQLWSH